MKDKAAELEAKTLAEAQALAEQVKVEAEQIGAELVTAEQNFVQKYGQTLAHGVELFLLLMIAAKLLGAI